MENPQMTKYARALGRMGSMYNPLEEKKELPDFIQKKIDEKNGKKEDDDEDKKEDDDKKKDKKEMKESVELTKEMVIEYLVDEGYANNEVSAEILHQHVSDDFLANIEEMMIESAE